MKSLRSQITPLLEDFKRSHGRGNTTTANIALIHIIEKLVSHVETLSKPEYSLRDAVDILHDAKYLIGDDYSAVLDHIDNEKFSEQEVVADTPTEELHMTLPKRSAGRPKKIRK